MDIASYLKRIAYNGPITPTAEALRNLHLAHLLTVPFENLSIHSGQPIILEDEALFDKIVTRRRGGFCYELNGLFAALLRALGFNVVMLSAGVAKADGGFSPDFDHMALLVTMQQRWLVDVGFGDSFRHPLVLDDRSEQKQGDRVYRIVSEENHFILRRRDSDEWKAQYRFTLQPYNYADYAGMCQYHQTSAESHFMSGRICTLLTTQGRITLSEMGLITTVDGGGRQERVPANEEEYASLLRTHFGIAQQEPALKDNVRFARDDDKNLSQ
ncbi:MAG: arylamine N-acetyltransferase [Pyrinomonadaceae bacterium]